MELKYYYIAIDRKLQDEDIYGVRNLVEIHRLLVVFTGCQRMKAIAQLKKGLECFHE